MKMTMRPTVFVYGYDNKAGLPYATARAFFVSISR
jgi:hypothetical protein